MRTSFLAIACIMMTLGLALGLNYGGYSYGFLPHAAPPSTAPDGTFLALFGILFLFLFFLNGNLFNFTSSSATTPFTIVG